MKYKHPQKVYAENVEIRKAYRGKAPKLNPKAIKKTKDGVRIIDANKVDKKTMLLMCKRGNTIITRMSGSIANLTDANLMLTKEIASVEVKFDNAEKTLAELIKEWKKMTKVWVHRERDYLKEIRRLGGTQ